MEGERERVLDGEYQAVRVLKDGTSITIRALGASDREAVREGIRGLSEGSRVRRFLMNVTEPSEAMLRYLTEVDQKDHVAIVAVQASADLKTEKGLGIARFVRLKGERGVAEAAITVADEAQNLGVGRHLLTELRRIAAEHGIGHFRAEVLASNEPMRAILDRVGAKIVADHGESVVFDVPLGEAEEGRPGIFDALRAAARLMLSSGT